MAKEAFKILPAPNNPYRYKRFKQYNPGKYFGLSGLVSCENEFRDKKIKKRINTFFISIVVLLVNLFSKSR